MIRSVLIVIAWLICGPAFALSCMRPDVARSFQEMESSRSVYVAVHGKLTFKEARLPKGDKSGQTKTPPKTRLRASLQGMSLGWDGFEHNFDRNITLIAQCHGPWCARPQSGQTYLAFVKRTKEGYELWVSPCGGRAFPEPSKEQLDVAHQCLRGNRCQAQ